jgi:hypothetical protein
MASSGQSLWGQKAKTDESTGLNLHEEFVLALVWKGASVDWRKL